MNRILHDEQFWRLYYALELDDLSADAVASQVEGLADDFTVRSEDVSFQYSGKTHTAVRKVVEFLFPLTGGAALVLEYEPETDGASINLFLQPEPDVRHEMGWWDLARWHPYCLRSQELELLLGFWQSAGRPWDDIDVPLLLLAPFVGLCDETEQAGLLEAVDEAYHSLCPSPSAGLPEPSVHLKDHYRWEQHPDLGWIFTSDVWACYSIRNEGHAGGEEGTFPFAAWARQISALQKSVD